jgi:hypothetical protein
VNPTRAKRDNRRAVTWALQTGSPAGVRLLTVLGHKDATPTETTAVIDQAHLEWEAAGRP